MHFHKLYILSFFLLCLCAKAQHFGYDLSNPWVEQLPDTLREISGITLVGKNELACVQDENGIVFIYDLDRKKINKYIPFAGNGDYEELAKVGKSLFVLRSDGSIFEIKNFEDKKRTVSTYSTDISASNNEGLCYDEANKRLLIGCKNKMEKGPLYKNKRFVYAFDLQTQQLLAQPAFIFNTDSIKAYIIKNDIPVPTVYKKKGKLTEPLLKFRISALCIHPITKQLYLLSAADYLLMVFNMDGSIQRMEVLDPKLFNKAEGITFFENGNMLISNEGQKGKPTLLKFTYQALHK